MNKTHWQDWGSACLGVWLFVTPWIFGVQDPTIGWNFWIVGAVVVVLAGFEFSAFSRTIEVLLAFLGTWIFLAPRIMDFTSDALTWNAAVVGLLIVAFAAWAIGDAHQLLPKLTRSKDDLRGDMPSMSLPDMHEHMPGYPAHRSDAGPGVLHPGVDTQSPGQTSHS